MKKNEKKNMFCNLEKRIFFIAPFLATLLAFHFKDAL
jgi:hypothetical protein